MKIDLIAILVVTRHTMEGLELFIERIEERRKDALQNLILMTS
jgi:hypothetical protein